MFENMNRWSWVIGKWDKDCPIEVFEFNRNISISPDIWQMLILNYNFKDVNHLSSLSIGYSTKLSNLEEFSSRIMVTEHIKSSNDKAFSVISRSILARRSVLLSKRDGNSLIMFDFRADNDTISALINYPQSVWCLVPVCTALSNQCNHP